MSYQCKLKIFEGPLDLLLHLLKEQKMDICDIPIAEITKQYMQYLEMMQEMNLELVGEYLVMAAELTRIKSKTLLPSPETDEEGDFGGGEDPRSELMRRLREYQRYRDAAFELRMKEHDRQQVFSRGGEIEIEEDSENSELMDATVFDLFTAYQKILDAKSFEKDYEIEITEMSVTDRMQYILDILNSSDSVTFESFFTVLNNKQEIIQISGKQLSYNNYNDLYSALSISKTLPKNNGVVIIKHANPCGVSINPNKIRFLVRS